MEEERFISLPVGLLSISGTAIFNKTQHSSFQRHFTVLTSAASCKAAGMGPEAI